MLSIIIPTYNEEANLPRLLNSLMPFNRGFEVIVVDGESSDSTVSIAQAHGVRVFITAASRGAQLKLGEKRSKGDVLWFLHADSVVNRSHLDALFNVFDKELDSQGNESFADEYSSPNETQTPKSSTVIGGNFSIRFSGSDSFSLWLNQFYKKIRKRGMYYGDSGIFIKKELLERLGGFPERRLMEDYTIARCMETSEYKTVCIQNPEIVSSSRRFFNRGKYRIVCGWILIHCMYYAGFSDTLMARIYNSKRLR